MKTKLQYTVCKEENCVDSSICSAKLRVSGPGLRNKIRGADL